MNRIEHVLILFIQATEKQKNDQILIPLSVRHYATIIEAECPVKVEVPKNTDLVVTKDFVGDIL